VPTCNEQREIIQSATTQISIQTTQLLLSLISNFGYGRKLGTLY